ncbi:phosphohydrolase [Halomonas elongata]|uniref:phosphohydrolase n=1 Tax=Halomonas elongata TaxID=2746 RepID=UPI00186B9FC9|nr:phosphohydrolase [Halomonas elongata]MBW5801339.1 taxilin [Halomonas elongata]
MVSLASCCFLINPAKPFFDAFFLRAFDMGHESGGCTKKTAFLISLITSLIVVIGLVAIFVLLSGGSRINDFLATGFIPSLHAAESYSSSFQSFLYQILGYERPSGFKELWSYQAGLYQIIITFLIAINGLVAAISVIYIKSTSEEKAEDVTRKYMEGNSFNALLQDRLSLVSEKTFLQAQRDFESETDKLYNDRQTLRYLERENIELKQQLKVISEKMAGLDREDSEGRENILTKGDD